MLDIGFQELIIVMGIALLVFGPYKLPELGRALGRAMREFRRASDEFRSTIETNLNLNDDSASSWSATGSTSTPAGGTATDAEPVSATVGTVVVEPESASEALPATPGPPVFAPTEPFCAQRGGRLLHRTACGWVSRIPEGDRVVLKTAAEGWEQGLKPCPACDPRDGDAEP